ncbi:RNA polymerase sigma factor ShbA [Antrihabitans sp. YC2-6]|uniref:RNA polymerase sigma factor ShbA n=1 Tax=Antrihabitans sp. YC2-6 TaxID=2799498 RepID=UPI0018F3D5E1|nr:RNA polymerase sigma factor ShbA [Antrihabitans sp. YC2-6]MBJ8345075.1 RNA polymerase sigma factor ShbA [Antrihabitans sp. YC2-6]
MADVATTRKLEALLPRAVAGEDRAIGEIIATVHPLMRRYCANRLGAPGDLQVTPDDVAQEICIATIRAIPRYEDQGKSFLAFVYGIAANKVADARRRSQSHPLHCVEELPEQICPAHGPEELALAGEQRVYIRKLMEVLSPKHKEVLVMRVVMGWSAAQTADALGTSAGVVRVMQHRALNRLRAELRQSALAVA